MQNNEGQQYICLTKNIHVSCVCNCLYLQNSHLAIYCDKEMSECIFWSINFKKYNNYSKVIVDGIKWFASLATWDPNTVHLSEQGVLQVLFFFDNNAEDLQVYCR